MLCYSILRSQKATLLLIPYHFRIPPTSKNSIFIKILFFNLSLLFISNRFFHIGVIESHFPGLSQQSFFFLSFSLNLWHWFNTQSHTHRDPWCTDQPIQSPHTRSHTHKQTQTINKATHINTNHQTINRATHKPVGANNGHQTHHPSHWSETHTTD